MTDTVRTPTRSRENTRARLMDAALAVFSEVGLDAASVEAVTERAGFTRGAFYSNFASKDELFLELIGRETETKLERVADRVRGMRVRSLEDPIALVEQVLGASFRDAMPPALANEMRTHALRDPRTAEAYLAWQNGMIGRIGRIITEVLAACGMPLALRLPLGDVARLFVEVGNETIARAAMEGLDDRATTAELNRRLGTLAGVLIAPAGEAPTAAAG